MTYRTYISWLFSTLVMYTAFYCWHGVILSDFEFISFPFWLFLIASGVAYLFIGFLIATSYPLFSFGILIYKPRLRGLISGACCGAVIYFVALIVGFNFSKNTNLSGILFDLCWQVSEQALGGIAVGFAHIFIPEQPIQETEL